MSSKSFQFLADTINGAIQEFPALFYFPCDQVTPLGIQIVRDFDEDLCIIAKRVYVIRYGQDLFGSSKLNNLSDFLQLQSAGCGVCACTVCPALINGCFVLMNGCTVDMCNGCSTHEITMNNCFVLLNGCQALLN